MSNPEKTGAPAHRSEADIPKRIQAKLNLKKKILAFMGPPVNTSAHHTGADISKRIQATLNQGMANPRGSHPRGSLSRICQLMCVRESMRENGSRSKTKLLQFDGFADQLFALVYVRVINVRDALDTGIRCSRCFNLIILMFRGSLGCDCHMRDVTRSRIKCRRRTVFAFQMFAVSANTGDHRPPRIPFK